MNLCWKKCLGLHNKPIKAEVRPEHMLTVPKEEEEEDEVSLILQTACPILSPPLGTSHSKVWLVTDKEYK